MSVQRPPLVVIAGPTGVGKTAAAVALAARLPIEVISADSRQVYRGMDVATGKPTAAERSAVVHHLVDVVDPDERYHAARFAADATAAIDAARRRDRLPVVVGGTGLYLRALLRGLDPAPPADPEFRRELAGVVAAEGRPALHARLARAAPAMARRLHPNDEVRVVRALELVRAGSPVGEAQTRWREDACAWDVVHVGLTIGREALSRRLAARAAAMVAAGLLDEVRGLLARGYGRELPAMQSIGYREFARVLAGEIDPAEALRLMQRETVRYAKRQTTWFAREPSIEWIDVDRAGSAVAVATTIEAKIRSHGGGIE
ncbi:MAG TPA: tRNA (adenosine(37)-N6)-dimethylallyltransferase MiaA [Methylomirabilota bacterium]|jgi:tRNA dimethylallyltransferase|nr:tRNA (adenosine(37)-N6)-dimethylallyltransferase MiaA [Methylomirabilota bacterium]